MSINILLKSAC